MAISKIKVDSTEHELQTTLANITDLQSGEVKTKFRMAQKGYTSGATWYYKVCDFPTNGSSNYASAIISGRIGGWTSGNMSYVNALVWNRETPGIALIDIAGSATSTSAIWNIADLVLYTNGTSATAANTATLYVKCVGYFTFDLDLELFQSSGSITYDGSYVTTTPSGTLAAQSSTSTRRVEVINGKLYVAGSQLAFSSHDHSAATTSAAGFMSATDKSKLDGITASADSVSFTRSLTSGTKVGTITINGTGTDIYAPTDTNTDTKVTNTLATTTKAYVTGTTSSSTNTGTQVFDTGVYLTTTAGELAATKFTGALNGNATTATTLANTRYVDGVSFNGSANVTRYATCSTAAATAAKTASVTAGTFSLITGARVTVKFTNANTASSPTLNIGSTGAKAIYWHGAALASTQYWAAGSVLDFVYNGTQWDLIGVAVDNNTDTNTDTKVTNTLATTTKAYVTGTTSSSTNTGTQVFDTGVYLTTTAGELAATKFTGALNGNASTASKLATPTAVQTNLASTTGASFDGSVDIKPGVTGTLAIGNGGTGATSATNALANLDARYRWSASIKCATWSRLCYVACQAGVIGAKYILNIGATRGNVVYNDTFLVTAHHSSNGKIIKIAGSNYSKGYQVRLLSDSNGNNYFELYDNCNSATSSTTQTVYCNLIPISTGAITRYTAFTDGTTLPTNFTVKQTMTLTNNDFQGSETIGSSTKPVYLSNGTITAGSTYAGGTAVTLNGSSKAASTASFYAPTSAGTSGQVLTSTGGAPSWTTPVTIQVTTYTESRS